MANQHSELARIHSPLAQWLPPPPPDTDNTNRRITDSFTVTLRPRDPTMVTPSSEPTYAARSSASDPHTGCSRHLAPASSSTSE